jgi:beta-phosphoglucomutase
MGEHTEHQAQPRGVALDLDGVLIDGMPFHVAAWDQALAEIGVAVDSRELYELEGVRTSEVVAELVRRHGLSIGLSARRRLVDRKRQLYADGFEVVPLPEAQALVCQLASYQYRLALVTGTTCASAERALRELELAGHFAAVVCAEDVINGKPAPEPYQKAIERLAVAPENCVVIENAPPGIEAAEAAGVSCVAVATYLPIDALVGLPGASRVFLDLLGLRSWLASEHTASSGRGPFRIHGNGAQ